MPTVRMGIRLPRAVAVAVDAVAERECRTRSAAIALLVADGLAELGIPVADPAPRRRGEVPRAVRPDSAPLVRVSLRLPAQLAEGAAILGRRDGRSVAVAVAVAVAAGLEARAASTEPLRRAA